MPTLCYLGYLASGWLDGSSSYALLPSVLGQKVQSVTLNVGLTMLSMALSHAAWETAAHSTCGYSCRLLENSAGADRQATDATTLVNLAYPPYPHPHHLKAYDVYFKRRYDMELSSGAITI